MARSLEQPGSFHWKRGIRGYSEHIFPCRVCGTPTNVYWECHGFVRSQLVCSEECADRLADKAGLDPNR